ncbi:DUF3422 family protein [Phaeobacter piscinae]|uniref:DUF3422 family protein n=1 Tax=Phaeobacter piscinae TaxID=1580596 RepID=UPI001FD3F461|nr:DUF3422 family protein [Phaeobacter piscinae]
MNGNVGEVRARVYGMESHEDRLVAVEEVHARPFPIVQASSALTQLAFMNEGNLEKDRATLAEISRRLGTENPDHETPHHGLTWNQSGLHCEKHTEFSTYLWRAPIDEKTGKLKGQDPFKMGFKAPGPVVCGIRLDVLPWSEENAKLIETFNPTSRCHSLVEEGMADIVTDFQQDRDGLTRMLILDHGLSPSRLGALAQRLLEIETYRTLSLLGIPMSREITPRLRRMEKRLSTVTAEMRLSARQKSEELLSELTDLSAELEAETAASLYRFGASKAYYEIVEERLTALGETFVPGCYRWRNFLHRRIAPAMRACRSVEERQANLSDKLARTTSLLRSWIDVQLERQNGDLLASMNERVRLQLRLQQTVEGLSVAAISYYVIGLLAYFIKGIPGLYSIVAPELAITAFVPVIVIAIWWSVRRIQKSHSEHNQDH